MIADSPVFEVEGPCLSAQTVAFNLLERLTGRFVLGIKVFSARPLSFLPKTDPRLRRIECPPVGTAAEKAQMLSRLFSETHLAGALRVYEAQTERVVSEVSFSRVLRGKIGEERRERIWLSADGEVGWEREGFDLLRWARELALPMILNAGLVFRGRAIGRGEGSSDEIELFNVATRIHGEPSPVYVSERGGMIPRLNVMGFLANQVFAGFGNISGADFQLLPFAGLNAFGFSFFAHPRRGSLCRFTFGSLDVTGEIAERMGESLVEIIERED
jgi:hypothetical protein